MEATRQQTHNVTCVFPLMHSESHLSVATRQQTHHVTCVNPLTHSASHLSLAVNLSFSTAGQLRIVFEPVPRAFRKGQEAMSLF